MTRRSEGQALPEFALVAPILFLLLFGVIQLGLIMAANNGLVNGVRDATRQAATYRVNEELIADDGSFNAVCTAVRAQLVTDLQREIPGFDPAKLTTVISYDFGQDPNATAWYVTARIEATFGTRMFLPLDPLLEVMGVGSTGKFGAGYFGLHASEQMRIENPDLPAPTLYSTGRTC
jgi:hypothetical protein